MLRPITSRSLPTGFTLMELTVVIAMIGLLAATAIPSIMNMFTAGADARAYNQMTSMLTSARTAAIQYGSYVIVRVQPAVRQQSIKVGNNLTWKWKDSDSPPNWYRRKAGLTYVTAFLYNAQANTCIVVPGFRPQPIPDQFVFGEVTEDFLITQGGDAFESTKLDTDAKIDNFISFNVIFSPSGAVVKTIPGVNIVTLLNTPNGAFTDGTSYTLNNAPLYSNDANCLRNEEGVTAMTMFDKAALDRIPSYADKIKYINENGQLIPMNLYTGQLYKRK